MKTLYYCALAHPHVAAALADQASETLRPFIAYLNAAKAAARVREARSACRWEPVPVERLLRFSPRDTLVEAPATEVGYRLAGWEGPPPRTCRCSSVLTFGRSNRFGRSVGMGNCGSG
ncbi:hypothetical protein KBD49_09620 [Myxococcota bacterium]|nr:hypothetical protein [Myxococcota bacterium]